MLITPLLISSPSLKFNLKSFFIYHTISGVESERTISKSRKRKFLCCVHLLHKAGAWNKEVSCRSRATMAENVQKGMMHVQSCCIANLNLLLFCPSHCPCHCDCLSSILLWSRNFATMVMWNHTSSLYLLLRLRVSKQNQAPVNDTKIPDMTSDSTYH